MITNKAALLVTLVLCLVTFSAQINSAQAEPLPKQGGDKDNSTREEKTHQVPLPRQIDDDENFVVIISIDGFPASALWNKQVAVPVIRELAEKGTWAKGLVPSTPSVTWPNHTTLVTGVHPEKHGMLTNGRLTRTTDGTSNIRETDLDREDMSSYPTLYDLASSAGLKTAGINWPVTRNTGSLHYNLADAPYAVENATPELRSELLEVGLLEDETTASLNQLGAVARDHAWTQMAAHLIRNHRPNVLLFHLLNTDGMHHRYGKESWPGNTALAYADMLVRDLLDALDDAGIRDQSTIFIVSDDGFMNVTKQRRPNVLRRRQGVLETGERRTIDNAHLQPRGWGGSARISARDPATKGEDMERGQAMFEGVEGIHRILAPDEYEAFGMPLPSDNSQMGDLVLAASDGYAFSGAAGGEEVVVTLDGTAGVHGYLNDNPQMEAVFVASGRGIRSGVELARVDNRSVAPTAARLLGLTLKTADGRVLDEILEWRSLN